MNTYRPIKPIILWLGSDVSDVKSDAANRIGFIRHIRGVLGVPHSVPHAVHILNVEVVGPANVVTTEAVDLHHDEKEACSHSEHLRSRHACNMWLGVASPRCQLANWCRWSLWRNCTVTQSCMGLVTLIDVMWALIALIVISTYSLWRYDLHTAC